MRKENLNLSVLIFLAVAISLSATYAYLELAPSGASATGQGGCFNVNYNVSDSNGNAVEKLEITSLQSTTDYQEGATFNITLSKNTNCEIYTEADILIHTNSDLSVTSAPIDTCQALKYRIDVEDGEGKILIKTTNSDGEEEIEEVTTKTGIITTNKDAEGNDIGLSLANVKLTENDTTYKIYLWIDSSISGGNYHNKTYSGYFYASSTQSSDVK